MNDGKVYKLFYSTDSTTLRLINEAISTWPFGFCKLIEPLTASQDKGWIIEINRQSDQESVEVIIDAYMHIRCGFSYFDLDSADMNVWLSSGNRFRSITVQGKTKEMANNLLSSLLKKINTERKLGFNIETILLTVTGRILDLEEISLYTSIVDSLGYKTIINTNLFEDDDIDNMIKLHLSLSAINSRIN